MKPSANLLDYIASNQTSSTLLNGMLIGLTNKTRKSSLYSFHKYQTKTMGLAGDKQKLEHFACCQLQTQGQVIMTLSLINASWAHVVSHLCNPWANFIMFRHWRAWLKCYYFIALGVNGWRDHYAQFCGLITRHVLCVCVRVVSLWTPHFQNAKQRRSRMNRAPLF